MRGKSENEREQRTKHTIGRSRDFGVAICMLVMIAGCIIGALFFARPTTSTEERRDLTALPELTAESFFDGSYFSELSLWYADTYPLREPMVSASQTMHRVYGVSGGPAMVNANVQADMVPVDSSTLETSDAANPPATADETSAPLAPAIEKPSIDEEIPWGRAIDEAVQNSIMNGLYIKDGTAFSICYFSQTGADLYVAAANELASQLEGAAHVYSLLVPSSAVLLPQEEYDSIGGSDQRQVLDYVWARFDDGVTHVDVLDAMREHSDDYVFFRTDHHWTMRGAYLGYVEFCKARGIKPAALDSFEYRDMGQFAGTFYDTILAYGDAAIDEFETFTPTATNDMVRRSGYGDEVADLVVQDSSEWDVYGKYDSLSGCDPANGYIHNPKIHDGSSCLVVKDSYGSAFIPFLVESYEHVHMIDTRNYPGTISDYVRDNQIQDVILVYGIKVGLDDQFASLLYSCVAG